MDTGWHPSPLGTSAALVQAEWRLPIVRVAFTDSSLRHSAADLDRALFDTTGATGSGSFAEYYTWVSGRRIKVRGEVVATAILPHDRNYYAYDSYGLNAISTPNNSLGMLRDAVVIANPLVDWSRYDLDGDGFVDMVWIVHAGIGAELSTSTRNLWSITSRASTGWGNASAIETDDFVPGSFTQKLRIDRFTVLPELSAFHPGALCEIGVYCHEFGHALGLPDLYDTTSLGGGANAGPGNWSLMSTGAYGGDNRSPESPVHVGAWPALFMGWSERLRPTTDTLLTIAPIASGGPVVEFWFEGEANSEHFLLENRRRQDFDRSLLEDGLIVYQVDEALIGQRLAANRVNTGPTPGLRILEADGDFDLGRGINRADTSDPFPGALGRTRLDDETSPALRAINGAGTNLALDAITLVGANVRALLQVRAAGWNAIENVTEASAATLTDPGPAPRAVVTPQGDEYLVSSDFRSGIPQVLFRERRHGAEWSPSLALSSSARGALEPTIVRLPGDDLAVAWTDRAGGIEQIHYRARIRGNWAAVRAVTQTTDVCGSPALAADASGRVFLAWLEQTEGRPRLKFMRFLYSAPFGQPTTVTGVDDLPTAPILAAGRDGRAFLLWPDRGTGSHTIWGARFTPDSGLSVRFRLAPQTLNAQPSVGALVDTSGALHTVWQVSGGGVNEIHYQKRPRIGAPSPRDTTIDSQGYGLQSPRLAMDLLGGLHVAYDRAGLTGQQVRYKRWRANKGWDFRATQVSGLNDGECTTLAVLPISNGDVSVLYQTTDAQGTRLLERSRRLDGGAVADVREVPPARPSGLTLGPNPLRAGQSLGIAGFALGGAHLIDLYDSAGRRVASTAIASQGDRAGFASAVTAALKPGLYFARVRENGASARLVVLR
ncbi:MAG: M6 family metalloprotease domain-containing protein [Candidatus Eisenbacteria bacterium]